MAKIALIYGRDTSAEKCARSILGRLGHEVKAFPDAKATVDGRPFNPDIVKELLRGVDAALVVLSPDEESMLRVSLRSPDSDAWSMQKRLRPNVCLEYGMAVATLGDKVIEVSFGFDHRDLPSDFMGLNPILYSDVESTASEVENRLRKLGIVSPRNEVVDLIQYSAPEPAIEEALPPYDFIRYPWKLDRIELNILWSGQREIYENLGYEISCDYEARRASWEQSGYSPLILKDVCERRYVLAHFRVLQSDQAFKMWIARKRA